MRLINTSTLELEQFFDSKTPEYVVLSHTWGRNEVSFQEFQNGEVSDKIRNCCKQAQKDRFQYAWIDTCCIDKTSSAELSESINSMYRFYSESSLCYAFLDDYSEPGHEQNWWERNETDTRRLKAEFEQCRWFTRGWTLQELIAPSSVKFYDANWTYFGTRMTLQDAISAVVPVPSIGSRGLSIKLPFFLHPSDDFPRKGWAALCSLKRPDVRLFCLPVEQTDATSHIHIRRYVDNRLYLIPHSPALNARMYGVVKDMDLQRFVYSNLNLQISTSLQYKRPSFFSLKAFVPQDAYTRFCSLQLIKVFTHKVQDFQAGASYESADDMIILFRYVNGESGLITGGIVVGLRNGTPWCSIIRQMFKADFYSLHALDSRLKLSETLEHCTDIAGSPGKTRDLCRMRVGTAEHFAFMVIRVTKFASESSSPYPILVLEVAMGLEESERKYDELGVLDCDLHLYQDLLRAKDARRGGIAIESRDEPPHWRKKELGALIKADEYQQQPPRRVEWPSWREILKFL